MAATPHQQLITVEGLLRPLRLLLAPFRHRKNQRTYRVLLGARLSKSIARPLEEGDTLVIYTDELGNCHARLHEEFHDGRFEQLEED